MVDYVDILKSTIALQESMELDRKVGLFVSVNPTFVSVGMLYADALAENLTAFDTLLNFSSLLSEAVPWTNGTISTLMQSIQYTAPSARRTQATTAMKPSLELYLKIHKAWAKRNKAPTSQVFYTIQPLASGAVTSGEGKGGNIMGNEKTPQQWYAFAGFWSDPSQDQQGFEDTDGLRR